MHDTDDTAPAGPAGDPQVVLRRATAADAVTAARLHTSQIGEGFLVRLGPLFVDRLYRRIARSPESFILVAEADAGTTNVGEAGSPGSSGVAGFVAGTLDVGALYRRFLVRDGVAALVVSFPRIVRSVPRVWETLRHGSGTTGHAGGAELLAIAVDPRWRGRHVGRHLVEAFQAEVTARGATGARVVVGADNAAAVSLYGATGFTTERRFELHRGTASLLMRWGDGAPAPGHTP